MKTSRKWIQQYVDIADYSDEEVAKKLTAAGLEVEGIEPLAHGTNLTIGYVLTCEDHPDSDHLHVTTVDVGSEQVQIVCGAPNVAAGQKVIVAKVGAKLPEMNIKASTVRGIESNGMICSLLELGVSEKSLTEEQKNGIEILNDDAQVGGNPLAYLGLDDVVFDIGLTPNRNDCLAAFSFMKECGAIFEQKVTLPHPHYQANVKEATISTISMSEKANFFMGCAISGMEVKESPEWMKQILQVAGVKSINNVVDISNIVMLETGQPLHFYDADCLESSQLSIKDDYEGTFTALDGNDYTIMSGDLMIFDGEKPVGIAGIMGGEHTKVSPTTTSIVIESAHFNHVSIRNTSRRLNLQSDASIRFQKGIEPNAAIKAMDRAITLLVEYANAKFVEPTVGRIEETPNKEVVLTLEHTNRLLGTHFTMDTIKSIISRLDFAYQVHGETLKVSVPSYRTDLVIEQDLIEEVLRLEGFDAIPSTLPILPATVGALTHEQRARRRIRQLLCGYGINEALTYTLTSQENQDRAIMPLGSQVNLASPMSEDRKVVRGSILPNLLESLAYNHARSLKDVSFFEISNVYAQNYYEERLAIVMSGMLQDTKWLKQGIKADFYAMKGIVETLLTTLGFEGTRVAIKENTLDTTMFHPYRSATIYLGKEVIGVFGEIHPLMAKQYGVSNTVMLELKLTNLYQTKTSKVKFAPISKYPSMSRDFAFVVEQSVSAQSIIDTIRKSDKNFIQSIEIFDVYSGEHVEAGKKSIALRVTLQAKDHTMVEAEVQEVVTKIMNNLEKQVQAVLRS